MTLEQQIEKIVSKIEKEIKKKAPIQAGKRLAKEAPKIIENAMNQFYLAYNPETYNRTYGLFDGVISGINCRTEGSTFIISVTSDFIPDHLHDSGDYIFMGAFEQGIHGNSSIFISTPPWMYYEDDLRERYDELVYEEVQKIIGKYI